MVPGRMPNGRRKSDLRLKMSKGKLPSGQSAARLKKKNSWWSEYHYSFNSVSTSSLILRNHFLAEIRRVHFNLDNPLEKGSYFLLSPEFQHKIMKRRMFANVNINTCCGIARFPHSAAAIFSHWMSHLTRQALWSRRPWVQSQLRAGIITGTLSLVFWASVWWHLL